MKKETGNYIFQLLKAFIFDEKPVLAGDPDWDDIFNCAKMHSLCGTVGYVITKYGLCDHADTAAQFEQEMIYLYGYQYRRKVQMEKLIRILNENKIDHILMKGYLVKDLYPVPELRWYGDIDFVIHKEDRKKTDELMKNLEYESTENWEPVYSYKKDTEYYEIHTEILDSEINKGSQREYFSDLWTHAHQVCEHTYHFDEEYHFVYLIAHLAKHASRQGAGVRMYLDIALCIRNRGNSLNWNEILKRLDELELRRFFNTVCAVCELWFGIKAPCGYERIDPEAIDVFTQMTLEGGTFGFHTANAALETLKEADESESRIKTVMRQIFPPLNEIKTRYTYLEKHKWLLPVAWIDRVIRNRNLLGKRIQMAKEIVTAEDSEIQRIRELNEKIGL